MRRRPSSRVPDRALAADLLATRRKDIRDCQSVLSGVLRCPDQLDGERNQQLELHYEYGTLALPMAWSISGPTTITLTTSTGFLKLAEEQIEIPATEDHGAMLVDFPVFASQLANFAAVVRGQQEPCMPLDGSLVNAYVVEALVNSFLCGDPVEIHLPDDIVAEFPAVNVMQEPMK